MFATGNHFRRSLRRIIACVVLATAALVLTPGMGSAHPLSTTALLLDIGADGVDGQVQLPIDRLAIALGEPLTADSVIAPATLEQLRHYVANHLDVTAAEDGAPWATSVRNGRVRSIDGVDHLVFDFVSRPPDGTVRDLVVHYDAIVHHLLSHRIFVSVRDDGADAYTALGVLDWETQHISVPVRTPTIEQGFLAAVHLGISHITEGADHLLFLIMLLLPAPLLVRSGRWVRADDLRRHSMRIVHVVTAFAVGHSITLALAAFGLLSLPTRLVESLIALSILVSGVHALRPLVRGGEVWIAAGFGLMHGVAFATLLGSSALGRGSLVTELLGFNLGIELTQLLVVALVMPSLVVLSRTKLYPTVRIALAGLGVVLATAWLAERTTLIAANPFDGVTTALVTHPLLIAAGLATFAALTVATAGVVKQST